MQPPNTLSATTPPSTSSSCYLSSLLSLFQISASGCIDLPLVIKKAASLLRPNCRIPSPASAAFTQPDPAQSPRSSPLRAYTLWSMNDLFTNRLPAQRISRLTVHVFSIIQYRCGPRPCYVPLSGKFTLLLADRQPFTPRFHQRLYAN